MVCTLGHGRMAAMTRLLKIRPSPEASVEEAIREKIAVQAIHREFIDADEANLLDEEDMHVFDSRPLTDPLHLVCCNACKKPIKASQYATHAERCRSVNSVKDSLLELDGSSFLKKPPRKWTRSSEGIRNNESKAGGQDKSTDGNDVAAPELNVDNQSGILSMLAGEAQNVPVPLATKIYHSHGSNRLRLALGQLYHETSAKQHSQDSRSPELMQDKCVLPSQVSSPSKSLRGFPKDGVPQKSIENSLPKPGMQVATAPVGMMKARYHTGSYSYSGNTGQTLGTMQPVNRDFSSRAISMG